MKRLFRDRMEYIESADEGEGCFICEAIGSGDDQDNLVLLRGEAAVVMLNRYPYNTGHVFTAPLRHVGELEDLTPEERGELLDQAARCVAVIREEMDAEGFNLGANLGRVAGAGLPGHFHLHVVPRWSGDTNFMPVVGGTKVLPEQLEQTYRRLRDRLRSKR